MRKQIEQTKAFKNLSLLQKQIYGRSKVIKDIEHHYIVAKNKGVELWEKEHQPPKIVRGIVLEMHNKKEAN